MYPQIKYNLTIKLAFIIYLYNIIIIYFFIFLKALLFIPFTTASSKPLLIFLFHTLIVSTNLIRKIAKRKKQG